MKTYRALILITLSLMTISCATIPPDRYNTQKGAAIGAGMGALLGQAIGGNTESTLIGLASGAVLGGLVGNSVDQDYQVAREAAQNDRPVVYYDRAGRAVEAIPDAADDPNCRRVRTRVWENGTMVKETVEEVCGGPSPPVVRYYQPPPPPRYYYSPPPPRSEFSIHLGIPIYRDHGGHHR